MLLTAVERGKAGRALGAGGGLADRAGEGRKGGEGYPGVEEEKEKYLCEGQNDRLWD